MIIFVLALLASLVAVYYIYLRPSLRDQPTFSEFYAFTDNFWAAVRLKTQGLKGKLTVALTAVATVTVQAYDWLNPLFGQVDTTPLTDKIPSWAWPIIMLVFLSIMQYFRHLSEKREDRIAAIEKTKEG